MSVRDPLKSREHYLKTTREDEAEVEQHEKLHLPPLNAPLSLLRVARARYSAGESVAECRNAINAAANWRMEFFRRNEYHLLGYGTIAMDLEVFGGAALVDRAAELAGALRRCTIKAPPPPPLAALMKQHIALWLGEKPALTQQEAAALCKVARPWAALPKVFEAVMVHDLEGLVAGLEIYLTHTWARDVKAAAREVGYAGRWCFLAAGLCQHVQVVPNLTAQAADYVPVELLALP